MIDQIGAQSRSCLAPALAKFGLLVLCAAGCNTRVLMVARPDDRFAETSAEESNGSAVIEVDRDNPPLRGRLAATAQPIEVYNRSTTSAPIVSLGWNRALRIVGAPYFADTALGAGGLLPSDPGADIGPRAGAH